MAPVASGTTEHNEAHPVPQKSRNHMTMAEDGYLRARDMVIFRWVGTLGLTGQKCLERFEDFDAVLRGE